MNLSLKIRILRYWAAMNATAFDSAINAVYIFCGLAGVSQIAPGTVTAMTLQQVGFVFLIAFAKALIGYLKANPVSRFFLPPEPAPPIPTQRLEIINDVSSSSQPKPAADTAPTMTTP